MATTLNILTIATPGRRAVCTITEVREPRVVAFSWTSKLNYTATAVPMTYQGKNGKLYVAIIASVGGGKGRTPGA